MLVEKSLHKVAAEVPPSRWSSGGDHASSRQTGHQGQDGCVSCLVALPYHLVLHY